MPAQRTLASLITGTAAFAAAPIGPVGVSLPDRVAGEGTIEYLLRLRRNHASSVATEGEWAHRIQVSKATLRAAMDAGVLAWGRRGTGRSHAARVIDADALLAWVSMRDAVDRGAIAPPAHWPRLSPARVTGRGALNVTALPKARRQIVDMARSA